MARPDRAVVAVVGDGSSLYSIQALWSAVTYSAGVLFIVLRNGGYAIMNRLAERAGADGPWPSLEAIDIAAMARAQGCEARRIETHEALLATLDAELVGRSTPLLLEVVVGQDASFDP
jgi:benzoylformate decarboxylase